MSYFNSFIGYQTKLTTIENTIIEGHLKVVEGVLGICDGETFTPVNDIEYVKSELNIDQAYYDSLTEEDKYIAPDVEEPPVE